MTAISLLLLLLDGSTALTDGLFADLALRYGVHSRVQLRTPSGGERGLFTTAAVKAGEPVLAVPFELCLVCQAEAGDEAICSPWDAPHRDARDTLLARQLLAALSETNSPATISSLQRDFWQEWSTMLPEPGTLAHPITLCAPILQMLQDEQLSKAARLQQDRVDAVLHEQQVPSCAEVSGRNGSSKSAVSTASPSDSEAAALRHWAVALCCSRPFSIPIASEMPEQGAEYLASFVPFVDMANHAEVPNCEVQGRGDGSMKGDEKDLAKCLSAVGLVASRDLEPGEEIFISYFGAAPNAHIFSRFGFTYGANRHDRVLGLPDTLQPLSAEAVRTTTAAFRGRWEDQQPYFEAALLSMPLTRQPSLGSLAETQAALALEVWLKEVAGREFTTTLEADEAELDELNRELSTSSARNVGAVMLDGEIGVRPSTYAAILAYRVERKRLWRTAIDIVKAHQEAHQ